MYQYPALLADLRSALQHQQPGDLTLQLPALLRPRGVEPPVTVELLVIRLDQQRFQIATPR